MNITNDTNVKESCMLKLITPFRVLFNLDSSKIAARPAVFMEFLHKVQDALENPASTLARTLNPALQVMVNLPPKAEENDNARDHGRFLLSPHLFTLRFLKTHQAEIAAIYHRAAAQADSRTAAYSAMLRPDMDSLKIRLNDNTIAILFLDLHLEREQMVTGEEGWKQLNQWVEILIKSMLRELYPLMIFPLLKGLNAFSNATKDYFVYDVSEYKIFFVLVGDPANPYPDLHTRFIAMQTNITLCYPGDYAQNQWITGITAHGTCVRLKGMEVYVNDENNLVVLPHAANQEVLEIFWEIISSASYYYIAMNVININLIRYIGITSDKHTTKGLRIISRDMEQIINSVTILKVRYTDLAGELTGVARKLFVALQKEWDFRNITENMQSKLELCRTNIKTLSVETQRRNQGRIETVLTGVAGMSILSVFIELGSYATQMPPENRAMVGNYPGFMSLGFEYSGNTLGWIGIAMAVAVLLFTIRHRSG